MAVWVISGFDGAGLFVTPRQIGPFGLVVLYLISTFVGKNPNKRSIFWLNH